MASHGLWWQDDESALPFAKLEIPVVVVLGAKPTVQLRASPRRQQYVGQTVSDFPFLILTEKESCATLGVVSTDYQLLH